MNTQQIDQYLVLVQNSLQKLENVDQQFKMCIRQTQPQQVTEQLRFATEDLLKSVDLIAAQTSEDKKNGNVSFVPPEIETELNTPQEFLTPLREKEQAINNYQSRLNSLNQLSIQLNR